MTYPKRLLRSFQDLSALVLSHETIESTVEVICELAVKTIPPCEVASVSLVKADGISTVGSSSDAAVALDAIQYETGQGPCLDAIEREAMWFQVDEMSSDTNWPFFSARAAEEGFESLLSFTLRIDADTLGALNLYASDPHVYAEEDREYGAIYAAHAAVALANAQAEAGVSREGREGLKEQSVTQEVIARAVGILMEKEFRSSEDALGVLETRADELNIKLRDSAQEVIEAADRDRAELELPDGFTDRMMNRAQGERPSRTRHTPDALMLIAILIIGGLVVVAMVLNTRLADTRQDLQALGEALSSSPISGEEAIELSGPSGATARLIPSQSGSVFVVSGLTEPPADRAYQLWLLHDTEVVGSRVFDVEDGIALLEVARPAEAFDQVIVTVEPSGGSQEPTTNPVLASR